MKKILVSFFAAFSLSYFSLSFAVFAISVEERNQEMHDLTPEREKFHTELLNIYAPDLYHSGKFIEVEIKDENGKVIKSVRYDTADAPVAPTFDGDQDFRNNRVNIDQTVVENGKTKAKFPLKAKVDGSVIDSKTHWVLAYSIYHAVDRQAKGGKGHANDTEAIIHFVRKPTQEEMKDPKKKWGHIEMTLTRIHGFIGVYAPDPAAEKIYQANYVNELGKDDFFKKDRIAYNNTEWLDRFSKAHRENGPTNYRLEAGQPRHFSAFVCEQGHAIYRCHIPSWQAGQGEGYIYKCAPLGMEGETPCYPPLPVDKRVVNYSINYWDPAFMLNFPPAHIKKALAENKLSPEMAEKLKEAEANVANQYQGPQPNTIVTPVSDGKVRRRADVMKDYAAPAGEGPEANFFFDWNLRMGPEMTLSVPHLVFNKLRGNDVKDEDKMSDVYDFNLFIEYVAVN